MKHVSSCVWCCTSLGLFLSCKLGRVQQAEDFPDMSTHRSTPYHFTSVVEQCSIFFRVGVKLPAENAGLGLLEPSFCARTPAAVQQRLRFSWKA